MHHCANRSRLGSKWEGALLSAPWQSGSWQSVVCFKSSIWLIPLSVHDNVVPSPPCDYAVMLWQDMMKTQAGAAIAQQRHAFMEAYLQQFMLEWEGTA